MTTRVYSQYAFPAGEIDRVDASEVEHILKATREALRSHGVPDGADVKLRFAEDEIFGGHILRMTWDPADG